VLAMGWVTGAFYGLLDGLGLAGMIITSDDGSFPKIPCEAPVYVESHT